MPYFRVSGLVTISVSVTVEADDEAEAREKAPELSMQQLCHQCANGDPDCWSTSGELDGTPKIEKIEEVDEDEIER